MRAVGDFCDYRDTDGFGRVCEVHHRSIMPAMRVCREWGSLLLDEKTQVVRRCRLHGVARRVPPARRVLGARAGDGDAQLRAGNGCLRHLD